MKTLIRGGYLVTLDPDVGELEADLLIEGEKIAAIAPDLEIDDCEIVDATGGVVLPGFVDTHRHMWQGQLRGVGADWTVHEYMQGVRTTLAPRYRPEDVYAGIFISALEALEAGITTVLDFANIMNSPEHADAAVAALRDSGIRAVFAFGAPSNDQVVEWGVESRLKHSDDVRRVREQHFSANDGRVRLGMALRGPEFSTMEVTEHDWKLARELDVRITAHVGDGIKGLRYRPIDRLDSLGLLGPDTVYSHCNTLSDGALRRIGETGGFASVSPEAELHIGNGWPATGRLLAAGVRPTLSMDSVTAVGGDLFGAMRVALALERGAANEEVLKTGRSVGQLELTTKDALEWATIDGARACGFTKVGTLTPGNDADLILVKSEQINLVPLNHPVGQVVLAAHPGDVDSVFVAGQPIKRSGKLVHVDVAKARRMATDSRDFIFRAAGVPLDPNWHPAVQPEWRGETGLEDNRLILEPTE